MYPIDKHDTARFDVDSQRGFASVCADGRPVEQGDHIGRSLNNQVIVVNCHEVVVL